MVISDDSRSSINILLSSAISSLLSTFITNPIEVAKLNRQYLVTTCPQYPHPDYRTLSSCECSKFKIQNSFKGIGIALPQFMFSNIIYMQFYEKIRKKLIKQTQNSGISTLIASLSSRIVVTTLAVPIESLRVRLSNLKQNVTFSNHNGLKVTLFRDLIYSGLFWSTLQFTRNLLAGKQYRQSQFDSKIQIFYINMIPSIITGAFVSTITTPIDTLKTRVQTESKQIPIFRGIQQIYKKQGLRGLFLGVQYRVLKNTLHSALYLQFYEWSLRNFNNY